VAAFDVTGAEMISIKDLLDDEKCFEAVRKLRWPQGAAIYPTIADAVPANLLGLRLG
jgi:hypothetical protein